MLEERILLMKRVVYSLLFIIGIGSFEGISGQKVAVASTQTNVAITINEAPPVVPNVNQVIPSSLSPASIRGHPQTTNTQYSHYPKTNGKLSPWWQPVGIVLCLLVGIRYLFYKQKTERRHLL